MPSSTTPPDHAAVRRHIQRQGGYAAFARQHDLNQRTAERIFSGARPAPRWLLDRVQGASQ